MKFHYLDIVRLRVDVRQPDAGLRMLFMPAGAVGTVVQAHEDLCDVEFLSYAQEHNGGQPIDATGLLELPVEQLDLVEAWQG